MLTPVILFVITPTSEITTVFLFLRRCLSPEDRHPIVVLLSTAVYYTWILLPEVNPCVVLQIREFLIAGLTAVLQKRLGELEENSRVLDRSNLPM